MKSRSHHHHRESIHGRGYFRRLGPGLVTGAADDDPSGIGTYSQVGAGFQFQLLWTALLALPLAAAVQETTARLGLVTGKGLAAIIREHYKAWVLWVTVTLVTAANTFNIGADLGSMAAATNLVIPIPAAVLVIGFAVIMAALEIFIPYHQYARVLKWLCLAILSYILVLLVINVSWGDVAQNTFIPNMTFNRTTIAALIAIFGTTISPYLFFWQTSEEVEEHKDRHRDGDTTVRHAELAAMRGDVVVGMGSGVVVMFAIMVTAGATIGKNGSVTISTAEQAAAALEPLAGRFTSLIFTLGIVGTGLLAVPVLAGSTAYALSETFGWREGLSLRMNQAKAFYGVIMASMFAGLMMNLVGVDSVRTLYFAAILNGLAAPPLIIVILLLARRNDVLGSRRSNALSQILVATAAVIISALPVLFIFAS
jgi:NRAMP (natural resistance-associated macrophage protein)-like metal ion transporter